MIREAEEEEETVEDRGGGNVEAAASTQCGTSTSARSLYDPHPSLTKIAEGVYEVPGRNMPMLGRDFFGDEVRRGALCTLFLRVGGEGDGSLNPDSGVEGDECWACGTEVWPGLVTGGVRLSPENDSIVL